MEKGRDTQKALCGALRARRPKALKKACRAILEEILSQKLFRACFLWGIAHLSRDTLQNGVSHRCVCVKLSTKGRYRTILGECQPPFKEVSHEMGYRSDSIAVWRDMGPLSLGKRGPWNLFPLFPDFGPDGPK